MRSKNWTLENPGHTLSVSFVCHSRLSLGLSGRASTERADTIGSVLAFAGIPGFLTNLEQTQVVQDESAQEWTAFFDAWWERFGGRQLTAEDVCRVVMPKSRDPVEYIDDPLVLALPEPLSANRDRGDGAFKRSLGRHLSKLRGRVFHGRKLKDAGLNKKSHVRFWQLVEMSFPPTTLFEMEGADGSEQS